VIAASLSHWRAPEARYLPPVVRMLDALRVLKLMSAGLQQGKVLMFTELSRALCLGYDSLEAILDQLESADIVCKTEGQGWLMMRDASHVRASELLRLFVLDSSSLLAEQQEDPLLRWLAACAGQLEQNTDLTLQELFAQSPA